MRKNFSKLAFREFSKQKEDGIFTYFLPPDRMAEARDQVLRLRKTMPMDSQNSDFIFCSRVYDRNATSDTLEAEDGFVKVSESLMRCERKNLEAVFERDLHLMPDYVLFEAKEVSSS